jgi:L-ascorbate metabolism protein UlaG (beta-lactamase superfamily)
MSGDTVLYDGVREVANRIHVNTALLHLGAVPFPVTGPVRYTMTARDAVKLCDLIRPHRVIPVHYEGWEHFKEGRAAIEAQSSEALRAVVRWLAIGTPMDVAV